MATILIIDDAAPIRLLFSTALQSAGYDVMLARSGREGLGLYRQKPADLVIVDMLMPDMDGMDTITELRHEFPDVKVIAVSGLVSEQSLINSSQLLGARRTLRKPINIDEMLNMVRHELAH